MSAPAIPFVDLKAQRDRIRERIDAAISRVVDHGLFIMGPEVTEFEANLAEYTGARHVITCANGTDALQLALMAKGIGPGDAVFVPSFTFVATAEAVVLVGATPVFIDVRPDTFNLDPASLDEAIGVATRRGLVPKVVIPVDLFGQPADYPGIRAVADRHGLTIVADAAQSVGGALNNCHVGTLAELTTVSFFPAKPLGCYGDGGAVLTHDDNFAEVLRSLRFHGKGSDKYDNVRIGMNSRLDTIQAAILMEKLPILTDEISMRESVAQRYSVGLADKVVVPHIMDGAASAWAQYTIRVPSENRDAIANNLKRRGIPTAVYYPLALTRQSGYARYPSAPSGTPVSERLAETVLSLPIHPHMDAADQDRVIAEVRMAVDELAGGGVTWK